MANISRGAGYFTQVVWANSVRVGMAKAVSGSGKTYIVALYTPPGNYMGGFEHVHPLK